MIIKNEIKLNQGSKEYIEDTFSKYAEVRTLDEVSNPIIHMYPVEDTVNEYGELEGFVDGLFFNLHVYDTEKMTVYKSKRLHDAITPYSDLTVSQIKCFKDLSTMIALRGKYKLGLYAAVSVELIK